MSPRYGKTGSGATRRNPGPARASRKRLDADVFVIYSALRIVTLKSDRAVADYPSGTLPASIPIRRLRPLHDFFAVQSDGDRFVPYDDVHCEPLIILYDSLDIVRPDILHMIKAAGFDGIAMGVVHLHLEAFAREAAVLKFGMKVDAAVRDRRRLDVYHQLEVFEIVVVDRSIVERVRHGTVRHQGVVDDLKRFLVPADFPVSEVLPVE